MIKSTLVGWCPVCETYVEPYRQGETCPGWGFRFHPSARLHKRRMFICRNENCELQEGFFRYEDYAQHTYSHTADLE